MIRSSICLLLATIAIAVRCIPESMTILTNDTLTLSVREIWGDLAENFSTMEVQGDGSSVVNFVESYITESLVNTSNGGRIGAWKVDREQSLLHIVGGGEYIQYKMDTDSLGRPRVEKIRSYPVSGSGQFCSGLAVAKNLTVVGCGGALSATLTVILPDGPLPAYKLNYSTMKNFNQHIRLDVSADGRLLSVYDGVSRDQRYAKHITVIYFASIDESGQLALINHAYAYAGQRFLAVRGAKILGKQAAYTMLASIVNLETNDFELQLCKLQVDLTAETVAIADCVEKGVAQMQISQGDIQFLFGVDYATLEIVGLFVESEKHFLMFCETKAGFEVGGCKKIDKLPVRRGMYSTLVNIFNVDMYDAAKREFSVELYSSVDFKIVSLFKITPNRTQTELTFDYFKDEFSVGSICFNGKQGSCSGAFLLYETFMKVYDTASIADSYIQVNGDQIQGGATSVIIKGLLKNGAVAFESYKLSVQQNLYSKLSVAEDAPAISGLVGSSFATPIQRSWFRGNDIRFDVHVDSPSSVHLVNDDAVSYTFDVSVTWSQIFIYSDVDVVTRSSDGIIYYFNCVKPYLETHVCINIAKEESIKDYEIDAVTSDVPYPDSNLARYIILVAKNQNGNYSVGAIKRGSSFGTKIQWAALGKGEGLRNVLVTVLYDQCLIFAVGERPNYDQLKAYQLNLPIASLPISILELATIDDKMMGLPERFLRPDQIRFNPYKPGMIDMILRSGYLLQLKTSYDSSTSKFRFVFGDKIWLGRSDLVLESLPVGYCNLGQEYFVWDAKWNIFSKSDKNDTSQYILRLSEMGVASITGMSCLTEASAIILWGKDMNGELLSVTVFGNMNMQAHSRIHTITHYDSIIGKSATVDYFRSFQVPDSKVYHAVLSGNKLYTRRTLLSGPYINVTLSDQTSPSDYLLLTLNNPAVGVSSELKTKYSKVDTDFIIKKKTTTAATLTQGRNNLEESVIIEGHTVQAEVSVPESIKDAVKLEGRFRTISNTTISATQVKMALGLTNPTILASSVSCTVYYGEDITTGYNTVSLRGSACNRDITLLAFSPILVRGIIRDNEAVIVGIFRKGSTLELGALTADFDSSKSFKVKMSVLEVSSISALSVVNTNKSESTTDSDLVVMMKIDSLARSDIYAMDSDSGRTTYLGSIDQCSDFWPFESKNGTGFIFRRSWEFSLLRFIVLSTKGSPSACSVDRIALELQQLLSKGIKCQENKNNTVGCVVSTHGTKSFRFDMTLIKLGSQSYFGSVIQHTYSSYANTHKPGTYLSEDISDDFIAFKSLDGNILIYKTTENPKGYIFTLIPPTVADEFSASSLDRQEYRTFSLLSNRDSSDYPWIQRLGVESGRTEMTTFQLQPLTLVVSKPIKNSEAAKIDIRLSASQDSHAFSIYSFYSSLDGGQKEDSTGWGAGSWFIVIFLTLLLVVFLGWFGWSFFKVRKDTGVAQGNYQRESNKNLSASKKDSDSLLTKIDTDKEGRRTLQG